MKTNKKPIISGKIDYIFDNCPTGLSIPEMSSLVREGKAKEVKEMINSHIRAMKILNNIK